MKRVIAKLHDFWEYPEKYENVSLYISTVAILLNIIVLLLKFHQF